jgi:hypothetical protein
MSETWKKDLSHIFQSIFFQDNFFKMSNRPVLVAPRPTYTRPQPGKECSIFKGQRAILNFTPGPQEWNRPLVVNLAPRDEICPLGGMFTPSFTPRVNTLYCLEEWRAKREFHPQGIISYPAPGDKIHLWGTTSALGTKFAPRGEVKNELCLRETQTWCRATDFVSYNTNRILSICVVWTNFVFRVGL